ncbi:MAG: hypothetical protein Faunusvirus32_1, partial [Faunusvirus sp.]
IITSLNKVGNATTSLNNALTTNTVTVNQSAAIKSLTVTGNVSLQPAASLLEGSDTFTPGTVTIGTAEGGSLTTMYNDTTLQTGSLHISVGSFAVDTGGIHSTSDIVSSQAVHCDVTGGFTYNNITTQSNSSGSAVAGWGGSAGVGPKAGTVFFTGMATLGSGLSQAFQISNLTSGSNIGMATMYHSLLSAGAYFHISNIVYTPGNYITITIINSGTVTSGVYSVTFSFMLYN